ncbi:MAG TPA: glycosyltransferase [Cyanobacteria bacterium UBA11149]|nr:glycosyltransferase [Cyanobacteria bacterium UBA11367]HBE57458.1 glycosyltransferase [Cyanobacteria bacterium UBA11366]HBK66063.1 glycosyltransferase [Cyanobacteria bacterium UBA11166]HBR76775.1 glycosyltransferase [Cyanobacteria bacterium UBA11159]HBS71534.1 glycosyltransferase [Cyanobacteria bacterium UBA11153]HBW89456.1 glycosyltransferase [Cyanobacteria bacterium UBA11149]HCA97361.1 glycosyltransferase [Cyanobacteria bacterium UBA9226]
MRVLALLPGGISDQILFFPTLDDIQAQYPNGEIDVIVEPRAKGAYRVCQSVNEVLTFDYKDRNGLADFGNLLGILRDREYDAAVALGGSSSIGFLLWMSGIPLRVGYASGLGQLFLSNPVPLKAEQYTAQMYHDLLQGFGISSPCPNLSIRIPQSDIDWAHTQRQQLGATDGSYILIHGGSSPRSQAKGIDKIYPAQKWQKIVENITQKQPNISIVAIQGPDDAEIVAAMKEACPDIKVILPPDLGKLAAIIASANLILCVDSAPLQLAVAVGTYTVGLFGPTNPAKCLPQNDRCIGIQSPTSRVSDISPDEVLKQVWTIDN